MVGTPGFSLSNFAVQLIPLVGAFLLIYYLVRRQLSAQYREECGRYIATIENALEGIIQTTKAGQFRYINPAYAAMLGYDSPAELKECTSDITRQIYVNPEVRADFLHRLERDGKARCEYQAWKKDRTTTWLLASSRVVNDRSGKLLYYESIVEDVSERRRVEANLKQTAESLARSNAELSRFAHTVAHDIKEPLRTVRTYSQLLMRDLEAQAGKEARTYFDFIIGATGRMKAFIDDILSFSELEWDESPIELLNLNDVVGEVMQNLNVAIREVGAKICIEPLPLIRGNRAKMLRLFQNLLSNSLKYRRDVPLVITITASVQGHQWTFAVADNGIGFKQEYSRKIFELFARVGDRARYAGSGMGLAMVKRIVELHGGRIWAESRPGVGSTFYFTAPDASLNWMPSLGPEENRGAVSSPPEDSSTRLLQGSDVFRDGA